MRELADVLKGAATGAGGIKGTWNITPIVAPLTAVNTLNATFDGETKRVATNWTGETFAAMTPFAGVVEFNTTFGTLAVDSVKKLGIRVSSSIWNASGLFLAALVIAPADFTVDDMKSLLLSYLTGSPDIPNPLLALQAGGSAGFKIYMVQTKFIDSTHPSGDGATSQMTSAGFHGELIGENSIIAGYISRKRIGGGSTPTIVPVAVAAFNYGEGTELQSMGIIDATSDDPVIPEDSKLFGAFLYMGTGSAFDDGWFDIISEAVPDRIVLPDGFEEPEEPEEPEPLPMTPINLYDAGDSGYVIMEGGSEGATFRVDSTFVSAGVYSTNLNVHVADITESSRFWALASIRPGGMTPGGASFNIALDNGSGDTITIKAELPFGRAFGSTPDMETLIDGVDLTLYSALDDYYANWALVFVNMVDEGITDRAVLIIPSVGTFPLQVEPGDTLSLILSSTHGVLDHEEFLVTINTDYNVLSGNMLTVEYDFKTLVDQFRATGLVGA